MLLLPQAPAFADTNVSGTIGTNTTWTLAGSPYIVTATVSVNSSSGPILTIEPGVTVKFTNNTGLYIGGGTSSPGGLRAAGTASAPIIFTSNDPSPAPGKWYGIMFQTGTSANTVLDYATVEYGGGGGLAGLYLSSASPSITNSIIQKSLTYGIYAINTSPLIQNNTITNNGSHGIYLYSLSSPSVIGNTISNNGSYGLYDPSGTAAVISDNTFSGNASYPVRTGINQTGSTNTYGTNGANAIEVVGGIVSQNLTMKNSGLPYVITSHINVYSTSGPVLTIDPGVTVKFSNSTGLNIGGGTSSPGGLKAAGTASAPIIFTSNDPSPAPGKWYGITFNAGTSANTVLDYATVEYGGGGGMGNLYLSSASPTITNSTIQKGSSAGIYATGSTSTPTVSGCTIDGNLNGVYAVSSASPKVNNNDITNNTTYGVFNGSSAPRLDATGNWWGDVNGPGTSGNKVNAYVDYSPYRSASIKVDTTPPAPPTVTSPMLTKSNPYTFTGTKEADSSIFFNNTIAVPLDGNTTWQYQVTLTEGPNNFNITSLDAAGNVSTPVPVTVTLDTTPPVISSSVPSANAFVNSVSTITVTLSDPYSGVDLNASLTGAAVKNAAGTPINGTWAVVGSQLVFTPSPVLTPDTYTVTLYPVDALVNKGAASFSFTLDTTAPAVQSLTMNPTSPHKAEAVTFTITFSEDMLTAVQPTVTFTQGFLHNTYTVTGNWVVNTKTWQGTYTFTSDTGDGTFTLTVSGAKDKAQNTMASVDAGTFVLDTTPPSAPGLDPVTTPTNNPNQMLHGSREADSAIVINNVQRIAADTNTTWSYNYPLTEGQNSLSILARDAAANDSIPTPATIVLDTTPPPFTINTYQNPSSSATQTLTGTKEAGCTVTLDGSQIIGPSDTSTTWSYTVTLTSEITRHFVFVAADAIGNTTTRTVDILFDDAPPASMPSAVLTADGSGHGNEIILSWTGYVETSDVAYYAVYKSPTPFTDVTGMTPIATVNKGTKTAKVTGLNPGSTYYFAVVAVDSAGNQISTVASVSATPTDTMAPEDVTNLAATAGYTTSQGNSITLTWTPSINSAGDLADQIIYVDSGTGYDSGISPGKTVTTYIKNGLNDATKYKFKITVKDTTHESTGTVIEAVTRLANPTNLAAAPGSGKTVLTWSAVSSIYAKQYNIYRKTTPTQLTDISTMTFIKSVTGTTYTDIGLTNDTTYQYAVTTVNTSGAERADVQSVNLTPRSDAIGPIIDSFDTVVNQVVTAPIMITATAHDAESAIGTIELAIDGVTVATQTGGSLSYFWNTVAATDGNHSVKLKATDSLGNITEDTRQVIVSLAPPTTPAITGHTVAQTTPKYLVNVTGTTPLYTTVTLQVNGLVVATSSTTSDSTFAFNAVELAEGDNILTVKASHRGGESPYSPGYKIAVDNGAPPAPQNLVGQVLPGGLIRFTWANASGEIPSGYNLYVGVSAFTSTAGASKTNTTPITYKYKEYNPDDDGLKYYAVTAVDSVGNESGISNVLSFSSDRLAPSVTSIEYHYYDANNTDTYPATAAGTGTVKVALTVSESLKELPFLSFEPASGSPIVPTMTKVDNTHYEGSFTITADSPHGPTTYKFSGKDLVGNRGNAQGTGISIDVKGPVASVQSPVTVLQITPTLVPVQVVFDEPAITTPLIGLKASDNTTASVTTLTTTDSGIHWTGSVDISAMPTGQAEFVLSEAKDQFGNIGATVSMGKTILLYTGIVPPPGVPGDLAAKSEKGGRVTFTWNPVTSYEPSAISYNLYRRAEGETTATKVQNGITGTVAQDTPAQDGTYYYSVASVGLLNSESPPSAEVQAISDRTGPQAPTNLALALTGNGVSATWTSPAGNEPAASYDLYRSNSPITTTTGLTPVATATATTAVDTSPVTAYSYYAVASVDALGNEGALSGSQQITFPVSPVRNLVLERIEQAAPQITWDAPADGAISGYYLYRNDSRITDAPITDRTYTDGYYSGGTVTYAISAVDSGGNESPKNVVTLPDISISLKDGTTLRRGLLETASIIIANNSSSSFAIDTLDIKVGDAPNSTITGPLDVSANGQLQLEKVLATAANAPSTIAVVMKATWNPAPGTTVRIYRTSAASVAGSSTALEIYSDPLVRGTDARVRIKVNNLGSSQMEFLTSENSGPTNKVKINLKDQDGNLLATGSLNQRTGPVVNIGSSAVARLNPGESFTSEPVTVTVPAAAPAKVMIEAVIENTYYHYSQPEQVTAPGMNGNIESSITETPYQATAAPDKSFYSPGQPVVIIGQAITTATPSAPVPVVPVKIGISLKGFDRYYTVTTDTQGRFTYTFTPESNEAGTYSVWAAHPDVTTRTVQATFTIAGLQIAPRSTAAWLVKNGSTDVPVKLTNTGDVALTNLQFTFETSQGITAGVINSGGTTLAAGETKSVILHISANSTAADTGYANLSVSAKPENQDSALTATSDVSLTLVQAVPVISTSPSYIDTGVMRGSQKTESFFITNAGADTLKNARIEGPSTSWLSLTMDKNIGDIPAGESKPAGLFIKPGETVPTGVYDDQIVIYSDNHTPYAYHVQVTITSSATGTVLFSVMNEFFVTVANASLTVQNQQLLELLYNVKTGADGSAAVYDIPEGRYAYNITAPYHLPYSGSFVVEPGRTTVVPIALEANLINIDWSVTPVILEDRYQITVTQTFETHVPTPVIVVEPPLATLPEMQLGEVYNGEFTITNYGLVSADYSGIYFPASIGDYDIEVLANIPDRLNAMQKVTVPYRVTRRMVTAGVINQGSWGHDLYAFNFDSPIHPFTDTPSSLFDEVNSYGSGSDMLNFSITATFRAVICPNSSNQRTTTRTGSHYITIGSTGPNLYGANPNIQQPDQPPPRPPRPPLNNNNKVTIPPNNNIAPITQFSCSGGSSEQRMPPSPSPAPNVYCAGYANVLVGASGLSSAVSVPPAGSNAINITSPADGSTITRSHVIIYGAMDAATAETSVVVEVSNPGTADTYRYPAQVNGKYFAASVPLTAGANTLKVIATDPGGAQKQASITVNASISSDKVTLTASPNAGILTMKASGQATLDVTFGATTNLQNPVVNYAWDLNGDGAVDLACNDLSTVTASYLQTGLYLATVTVTDKQGNKYTDTVVVNVLDSEKMKSIFAVIWNNTKTALANKDTESGLNYFLESSRDVYRKAFNVIIDELPTIIADMQDIEMIYVADDVAKYRINRVHNIEGTLQTITYYIYFVKDENGSWKIDQF